MRFIFLLIFGVLFFSATFAQDKLTGHVFENKTKVSLAGIKIEDLKTHVTAVSDSGGRFSIKTSIGDFLCFTGFSYQPDTLYLNNLKYIEVYLSLKQNMLNEVKVQNTQTRTGSLVAAPITGVLNSRTVLYQVDDSGRDKGGVKIKLFDSDNDRKKRKDSKIADDEEKQLAIFNVFQAKNLQKYVPLKDVEMDNFIILYTPDVQTYYGAGFNLVAYLNECYSKFLKIPAEDRKSETAFRLVLKSDTTKH